MFLVVSIVSGTDGIDTHATLYAISLYGLTNVVHNRSINGSADAHVVANHLAEIQYFVPAVRVYTIGTLMRTLANEVTDAAVVNDHVASVADVSGSHATSALTSACKDTTNARFLLS